MTNSDSDNVHRFPHQGEHMHADAEKVAALLREFERAPGEGIAVDVPLSPSPYHELDPANYSFEVRGGVLGHYNAAQSAKSEEVGDHVVRRYAEPRKKFFILSTEMKPKEGNIPLVEVLRVFKSAEDQEVASQAEVARLTAELPKPGLIRRVGHSLVGIVRGTPNPPAAKPARHLQRH